jgi:hypothetical protein
MPEKLKLDGDETDAFSRRARRLLGTGARRWTWIKRKFNRRIRKAARLRIHNVL